MSWFSKTLGKVANVGTFGMYGPVSNVLGGNANKYRANEAAYQPQTSEAAQNNLALQKLLQDQIASGTNPAARFAADQGMAQNASLLGSMHGISPAAFTNALSQANARTQGQAAGIGAAQQLGQEQLLGGLSGQMFGQGLGYQMNAQGINAGVTNANTAAQSQLIGGVLNAGGKAASMGAGGAPGGGAAVPGVWSGGGIDYRDQGGHVPGQAPVAGDAPQNDVVPAKLSPGEIVLPRSVAQSDDAPDKAAAFVEAIKASGGKGKPKGGDFAALLAKHRELDGRLKRLEHLAEGGEVKESGEGGGLADAWEAFKATVSGDKEAPEKINRALPDWLGGHGAVVKNRQRLAKMDAQTKE